MDNPDLEPLIMLAESENFAIFTGEDADGEVIFNIELSNITLHLYREEWEEFAAVIQEALGNQ